MLSDQEVESRLADTDVGALALSVVATHTLDVVWDTYRRLPCWPLVMLELAVFGVIGGRCLQDACGRALCL